MVSLKEAILIERDAFELSLMERVATHAPVSLEALHLIFKDHSWNRLFAAMDRLSRTGVLAITRVDRETYLISLGPRFDAHPHAVEKPSASRPLS